MPLKTITNRLRGLSIRLLQRIVLSGVPKVLATAVGLALVTFLLDFTLEVPVAVRAVFLLASLAVTGFVAWRHLLRPLFRKPTLDELALLVEATDPALNDRLISAIQLDRDLREGRAVESPELIEAMIAETRRQLEGYAFGKAVSLRPCLKPLGLGALAAALFATLWTLFPTEAGLWMERQILLRDTPWPRETTLVITIPEMDRYEPEITRNERGEIERVVLHVPERTSLQVQVTAEGKLPEEVDLVTAPLDDPELQQPISMGRPQGRPWFQHIFPQLTRYLLIFARGGDDDDDLPVYEIRVAKAPRVTRFWAEYDYPDYTGIEDRTISDANISAPEGTRITAHFRVNMPLASFQVIFESGPTHDLEPGPDDTYQVSFLVQRNDFYTYRLKGANGVTASDAPRYVITAELDQEPRIAISLPETAEVSVTPDGVLPLLGQASDDYGVEEIGYRWGTDPRSLDAGSAVLKDDGLLDPPGSRRIRFFTAVPVKSLVHPPVATEGEEDASPAPRPPMEGDYLYLGFLTTDNRRTEAAPEPHRVFSDFEYRIMVLAPKDLERELGQRIVQIKTWVERIRELSETRIQATEALLEAVRRTPEGEDPKEIRAAFLRMEKDLVRIVHDLVNTSRAFRRIHDSWLWNRLDRESPLTETLLAAHARLFRAMGDEDRQAVSAAAIEEVRPLLDESSTIGLLTIILDLFHKTAFEHGPRARKLVARANLVSESGEQADLLESALSEERLLKRDLILLADKLQAWEDFVGILQAFQDALEMQKGIKKKIEKITRK